MSQRNDVAALLDGLRVLDLSTRSGGAFCAKLLADLGADVVKVEEPARGDPIRHEPPLLPGLPPTAQSSLHQFVNANKRSLALDLTRAAGREVFRDLLKTADLVVETHRPGFLAAHGLGFDDLRAVRPDVVLVSITPYGQRGPRAADEGDDIVYQAASGLLYLSGELGGVPTHLPLYQAELTAGRYAAVAALGLTLEDARTAHHVDVSIAESMATVPPWHLLYYTYLGVVIGWTRTRSYKAPMDGDFLRCQDGHVCLTTIGGKSLEEWVIAFDLPELLIEGFDVPRSRVEHWERLQELFEARLGDVTRADFFAQMAQEGFVVGIVQSPGDLLACPHLGARQAFSTAVAEGQPPLRLPGPGFLLDGASPAPTVRAAPTLGQHTQEILAGELGYAPGTIARLRDEGVVAAAAAGGR